ncbi:MAG: inorganic diphosphatase [Bacteroidota bacterium]
MKQIILLALFSLLLSSCLQAPSGEAYTAATFTEKGIHAIIEIPAGTNAKVEFDVEEKRFAVDQEYGRDRIINFLPYPGNYGFIPGTLMDKERGGDGDALDILVIAPSVETGTLVEVRPIGALMLRDREEIDTKIIAVPLDSALNVIAADDYQTFVVKYHAAHQIIQNWFLNYKGPGEMELLGWRDEQYAMREIQKWTLHQPQRLKQ